MFVKFVTQIYNMMMKLVMMLIFCWEELLRGVCFTDLGHETIGLGVCYLLLFDSVWLNLSLGGRFDLPCTQYVRRYTAICIYYDDRWSFEN